ncbi:MAG: hypothetical protein ACRDYV_04495 [Acidimicrobiia bacterium]
MHARGARQRAGRFATLAGAVLLIALAGCKSTGQEEALGKEPSGPGAPVPDFDPKNFSDPTTIDNKWLPLRPGTQFIMEGEADRGEGLIRHRAVFTVTNLTKVINGVKTLVMLDRDYNGEQVAEAEIAFFAQDDEGNVWLLGEYPEEYEEGQFDGAPSTWIAGQAGAQPGILMPADPKKGEPPFLQGLAPHVDFQDLARVEDVNRKTCVPAGCYEGVMVIDEWDPGAQPQDGHQLKFQAPGVGNVRVEPRGGEEQETLVLVEQLELGPEAMTEVHAFARQLDAHAYETDARYSATIPIEGP